jgi:hypothetical protein
MAFYNPHDCFWYSESLDDMPKTAFPAKVKISERLPQMPLGVFPIMTLTPCGKWELDDVWSGVLGAAAKNVRDSIRQGLGTVDGVTKTVFIASPDLGNAIPFNGTSDAASLLVPYDTGIELRDGATYEVVISMLNGTTATSVHATAHLACPCLCYKSDPLPSPQIIPNTPILGVTAATLNSLYSFRYQYHPSAKSSGQGVFNVIGTGPTIASTVTTSSLNRHVDDNEIAGGISSLPVATSAVRATASDAIRPTLGFISGSITQRMIPPSFGVRTTCDVELFVKVTERMSGYEQD